MLFSSFFGNQDIHFYNLLSLLNNSIVLINMAKVHISNVKVLDNPAHFKNPFQFEITFQCDTDLAEGECCHCSQFSSDCCFVSVDV